MQTNALPRSGDQSGQVLADGAWQAGRCDVALGRPHGSGTDVWAGDIANAVDKCPGGHKQC
jgi:hypothetical protein